MKTRIPLLCLLLGLLLRLPAAAQRLPAVDSLFREKIALGEFAGAVVLVAREGRVEHLEAYGYKDPELGVPMDAHVILPIASLTKPLTALGVLMLCQEGAIELDAPVSDYLPHLHAMQACAIPDSLQTAVPTAAPTIRQLLTHTAGIGYGTGPTPTDRLYAAAGFPVWDRPLRTFADRIADIPLAFRPGTAWRYGYSYDLLGHLAEVVSGQPLDRYLEERLFRPLGMNDTGFCVPASKSDRLSDLFLFRAGRLERVDARHSSRYRRRPRALSGGGGWHDAYGGAVSTVGDLCRLAAWLLDGDGHLHPDLLDSRTRKAVLSNQIGALTAVNGHRYGFGFGVETGPSGATKAVYWGGAPYNAWLRIDCETRRIGILLTNTGPYRHCNILEAFRKAAFDDE